ncbi:hypothetical protein D1AOALGA4SA_12249 [Olavius algarvensis Delta 1 endosymbiont]|nr:hypothetical protein D1AOALGA4SA_12249 [Olavius algarvensis Delta 1 endosymbiont]
MGLGQKEHQFGSRNAAFDKLRRDNVGKMKAEDSSSFCELGASPFRLRFQLRPNTSGYDPTKRRGTPRTEDGYQVVFLPETQ